MTAGAEGAVCDYCGLHEDWWSIKCDNADGHQPRAGDVTTVWEGLVEDRLRLREMLHDDE